MTILCFIIWQFSFLLDRLKTLNDRKCHGIETFVSVWRGLHQKQNEGNERIVCIY